MQKLSEEGKQTNTQLQSEIVNSLLLIIGQGDEIIGVQKILAQPTHMT